MLYFVKHSMITKNLVLTREKLKDAQKVILIMMLQMMTKTQNKGFKILKFAKDIGLRVNTNKT